jgi:hypothetical protein
MINLNDDIDYYILVDGQGLDFGGGRIFEGKAEVFEQFQEWADSDEYEDPTLKDWTLGQLIENWAIDIKKYNGADFRELSDTELNETNN